MKAKNSCKSDFQPLMNNISNHLAGWKARLLSFAGHFQFLKYTVCNTIAYWIRGAINPKTCLKILSRICAEFLFFGDLEARKLHLIAWNHTCKPKKNGGLGIPNLMGLQFANTCSLIFRFYNAKSPLFAFLNAKYGLPWNLNQSISSPLWKEIGKVATQILPSIKLHSSSLSWKDREKPCFSSSLQFFYREDGIVDWYQHVWRVA